MEKIIENDKYEVYNLNISFKDSGHYTNTYVLKDKATNHAFVIDPAYNGRYIMDCLEKIKGNLKIIYLTHCHGDHTAALEEIYTSSLKENIKIYIHENDVDGIFDEDKNCKYILSEPNFTSLNNSDISSVKDGEILIVGNTTLEIIHTPGHTNGCSILYEKEYGILFTGDTIFSDCYGRTDLKSGSIVDMKESIGKIFDRFSNDITICPGHGDIVKLKDAKRNISLMLAFDL